MPRGNQYVKHQTHMQKLASQLRQALMTPYPRYLDLAASDIGEANRKSYQKASLNMYQNSKSKLEAKTW